VAVPEGQVPVVYICTTKHIKAFASIVSDIFLDSTVILDFLEVFTFPRSDNCSFSNKEFLS
jgi:hypothetical protein